LKIYFILHIPPPVHGSSIVGGIIKVSKLINESFDCRHINLGTSASVDEIGKNPAGKLLRYISLIWQVKKELIFFRPNICYLTISSKGIGFYKDVLIVLLAKLFRIKRVYHFHNKGVRTKQDRLIDNLLYRVVFKNADVILLSKYLYPDIQKYVPVERVHYCPNGIPDGKGLRAQSAGQDEEGSEHRAQGEVKDSPETFNFEPRTRNKKVTEILFLSHLIESKGVFVLLDALIILRERGILFHCKMIGGEGDVSEKQMRRKISEAGLTDDILLAGKKYGEDKQEAFEVADIFVHPTFNDCLPLVLLEAMQYSLPVVSTPEGAIPDVVEDGVTGFLVPQKDPIALAEKLEILIKAPNIRKSMGAAGRLKYEREFTLGIFETRLKEILEKIGGELK
jgi:glycosyltransferase involved in cell wall biosynthesis